MLLTRFLTALVLVPIVTAVVLWAGYPWVFAIVVGLWAMGAAEWGALSSIDGVKKYGYAALVAVVITALDILVQKYNFNMMPVMAVSTLWWGVALLWVSQFPRGFSQLDPESGQPVTPQSAQKLLLGLLILVPAGLALLLLKRFNAEHLLFILMVVWVADGGAYFAGKAFGKTKIAPKVSPGKSWAGLFGGVLAVVIWSWLAAGYFELSGAMQIKFAVLGLIISLFSVVGDFTQSMFKRHVSMKDSGNIFPGHGGVLDRLDSLMAAAPIYVCGLYYLGML